MVHRKSLGPNPKLSNFSGSCWQTQPYRPEMHCPSPFISYLFLRLFLSWWIIYPGYGYFQPCVPVPTVGTCNTEQRCVTGHLHFFPVRMVTIPSSDSDEPNPPEPFFVRPRSHNSRASIMYRTAVIGCSVLNSQYAQLFRYRRTCIANRWQNYAVRR